MENIRMQDAAWDLTQSVLCDRNCQQAAHSRKSLPASARESRAPLPPGALRALTWHFPNGQHLLSNSHLPLVLGIYLCRGRKRNTFVSCRKLTSYLHFRLSCGLYQTCSTCCRTSKILREEKYDLSSYFIQGVDDTEMKKKMLGLGCTE